jgi:hypothetical protein
MTSMKAKGGIAKFHWHEWHFDDVPEEQKLDCLFYELGRESVTIRKEMDEVKQFPSEERLRILGCIEKSKFTSKFRFQDFGIRFSDIMDYFPARPWIGIPITKRKKFSSRPGIVVGNEWPHLSDPLNEITNPEVTQEFFEATADLDYGLDPVRFVINWNFSDEAIRDSFKVWVQARKRNLTEIPEERYSRPGIQSDQKGKGARYVDARLRQVGIMRLLHRMPLTAAMLNAREHRSHIPSRGQAATRHWYKQRAAAERILHVFFENLPEQETPLSCGKRLLAVD